MNDLENTNNKDNKLPPINKIPSLYWRNATQGFRVIGGNNRKLITELNSRLNQAEECMRHKLDYALNKRKYRLYRIGKNRCQYCGVKICQTNP